MKKFTLLSILLFLVLGIYAHTYRVSSIELFEQTVKKLQPGDSIVLRDGIWKNANLVFTGKGEELKPITLTAETPGNVIFEGASCLRIGGEYLVVSNLIYQNGATPRSNVIEFRTSDDTPAYHCKLSNCVIDTYNQIDRKKKDFWVSLWGRYNEVAYCYFGGKTNQGTTFIVWPNGEGHNENYHHIHHNYFGYRPALGNNGGETLRIGTSQYNRESSRTIVEDNYFERCSGEVEIISIKSCDNKIIHNTFFECEGGVTLRHGNRNEVSSNFFYGNLKPNTGGVRIINQGHRVFNNVFYQLRGSDFRAPLVIMNGIPNTPDNGYVQVKDVIVSNNTFIDCGTPFELCVGAGERDRTLVPESTYIEDNLIYSPTSSTFVKTFDKIHGITFSNNVFLGASGISKEYGGIDDNPIIVQSGRFQLAYSNVSVPIEKYVLTDFMQKRRTENSSIGALLPITAKERLNLALRVNCGPKWYTPLVKSKPVMEGRTINITPGVDNLYRAISKAMPGDILLLAKGEYVNTRKMIIQENITLRALKMEDEKPIIRMNVPAQTVVMFELNGGSRMEVDGIELDGGSNQKYPAKYAFSTSKECQESYRLILKNCEIHGFMNQNGGSVMKAYQNSFADSIIVENCIVRDSYRGFALNEEKEDKGAYSAEYVVFENTLFQNITQWALDYYRGGNDESTLGGNLLIDHCVFDQVNDKENQLVVRQTGIKRIVVKNSIFSNSAAKYPIRLSGKDHLMTHCDLYRCGKISGSLGALVETILTENPKYLKKSFHLGTNSALIGKGTDGTSIGLK